jgi:hypothetical protein
MPKKENNKKSFDLRKKWEDRKEERNSKTKQIFVVENGESKWLKELTDD